MSGANRSDNDCRTIEADTVVLAAGTSSKALCAGIDFELPVESSPATLTRFAGPGGLVGRVVAGPDLAIRQDAAGRLFVSDYYVEGESPGALHFPCAPVAAGPETPAARGPAGAGSPMRFYCPRNPLERETKRICPAGNGHDFARQSRRDLIASSSIVE